MGGIHVMGSGEVMAAPRLRVSRQAALVLSTSWQRLDFNGSSSYDTNTFPLSVDNVNKMTYWDAANKLFKFKTLQDRNYDYSLYPHLTATGLLVDNNVQMRFVIPAPTPIYVPYPDDGGLMDIMAVGSQTDKRGVVTDQFYVTQNVRDYGLGIELRLKSTPVIQTVTLASAAFIIYGR